MPANPAAAFAAPGSDRYAIPTFTSVAEIGGRLFGADPEIEPVPVDAPPPPPVLVFPFPPRGPVPPPDFDSALPVPFLRSWIACCAGLPFEDVVDDAFFLPLG